MGTLGNKFHNERERRGLTLDDVSNVTKISSRMLKAIEDEHFDQLPGGVFNKGFIRAYARHLGLDGEEAVNEYLAWLRQAQVDANTVPAQRVQERRAPAITPAPIAPPPAPKIVATETKHEVKAPAASMSATSLAPAIPPATASPTVQPTAQPTAQKIDSQPTAEPVAHAPVRIVLVDTEPEPPRFQPPARDEVGLPDLQLPKAEHVRPKRPTGEGRRAIPWGLPVAATAVILVVAMLWNWHSRSASAGERAAVRKAPATTSNAAPPSSGSSNSAPISADAALAAAAHPAASTQSTTAAPKKSEFPATQASKVAASQPSQPVSPTQQSPASSAASKPAPKASTTTTLADGTTSRTVIDNEDVTSRVITRPPKPALQNPSAASKFTLVIRAIENSRVSVTADGQIVTQETLIAPAYTSVRATREIVVRTENGASVSFLLNGKEVSLPDAERTARTFVFNSNGLQSDPASAPTAQ